MSSNQEMKLKIDYDLTDTLEVNGTFATSYMIELNRYYQATIFPAGDKDNYKFTLDSNQIVRIKLDSVSSRTSMGVRISDDENVEIGYRTSITNTAPLDWGIVLKKGTYTLNLYAGWNEYSTKPYRIIVTKDTTDPTEWNGDTASAVNLEFGQPIKAAIYPNADYDFFKFNLPIADTVKINVDSISSSLSNFRVYLFDSEMNQKDYASYPIDGSTSLKKFLNAGLYYLRIQSGTDYNWNHSLKKYVLTVNKSTI